MLKAAFLGFALVQQTSSFVAPLPPPLRITNSAALLRPRPATVATQARRDKGSLAPPPKRENSMVINEQIKADPVRVIQAAGPGEPDAALGIMSLAEARQFADDAELDLVMVTATSDPPVVKVANAGKMRYALELKKKENQKKTNTKDLKEVKLTFNIAEHDYSVRQRAAQKFLEGGHRVKCTVQFRGRQQQHIERGEELLGQMAKDCEAVAAADKPRREGNRVFFFLNPKTEK